MQAFTIARCEPATGEWMFHEIKSYDRANALAQVNALNQGACEFSTPWGHEGGVGKGKPTHVYILVD